MPLTAFAVDEGPHSMDGLLLHAWEGPQRVEAFISRRVMDINRQHPFVDILFSDIAESQEALDTSELMREPPPPSFQRLPR